MSGLKYIGKQNSPEDGLDKVMGRAKYVGDIQLPGMLYARVLRSPVPHARIRNLDATPALKISGVKAVIVADDFIEHGNFGWPVKDAYILAWKKVRYVGDPIAAVAATSEEAALEGIRAIKLDLEELPGVFDPLHAMDSGAPLIPDVAPIDQGNLLNTHLVRNGDPDPILEQCEVILDETYNFAHQEHAYLETEGALAIPDSDGGIMVYANDQSPFINRNNLMMVLGLPEEKVRVIQPPVGGSFGGKDDIGYQTAAQVSALALKTGCPVRLILGREESMMASYKREAMQIHLVLGANKKGELQASKADLVVDSGAYASMSPLASWRATMHAAGAYRYRAASVDTQVYYTNNGYCGAFRGFGNTEAVAAIEQAIDELAYRLQIDPIDFRLMNCLKKGDRAFTGNLIDQEVSLSDCLKWVRDKSDWLTKRELYSKQTGKDIRRGIGVACYFHGCSLGGEGADYATTVLRIENDNTITLASGLTDYGQGSRTVFTLIAAETLGVNTSRIHMLRPDTQTAIESGPTVASRCSMLGGNASHIAAQKLNQLITWAAADAFACAPEQIFREGELFISPKEETLTFDEVVQHARKMGLTLSVQGKWKMPEFKWDFEKGEGIPYHCYVFGAQVAEIETNLNTGMTKVLNVWAAHDGGTIIFTQGAIGQMYGGIAQGIGYALKENIKYYQGYPNCLNYDRYLIPRASDMPAIEINYIQNDYPEGPYGAKNLAEPVMIATTPAIANALFQATGKRYRSAPFNPGGAASEQNRSLDEMVSACRKALGFSV